MIYAKKSYGQHFLKTESVCQKIVEAAEIGPDDLVIEVGPGRGALTKWLAPVTKNLILIETDQEMIDALRASSTHIWGDRGGSQIIKADAAQFDFCSLPVLSTGNWILVGNLPYNAGTAIVMNALTSKCPPKHMVVMLQKEVANKMMARPGQMSLLSVAVQMYAMPSRVIDVKPGSFSPPPKVDSTVIRLDVITGQVTDLPLRRDNEAVISLAKIAFATPRKQLHRTLADAGKATSEAIKKILVELSLPETARPQELSISQWNELYSIIQIGNQ